MKKIPKIANFCVDRRRPLLLLFLALTIASAFLIPGVRVNYDLSRYLPEDMPTKTAIRVMEREFGFPGMAQVMVEDVTVAQAKQLKGKIKAVAGVKNVLWLDDIADIYQPLETLDESLVKEYYKDGAALFNVEFSGNDYAASTGEAIEAIQSIIGDKGCMEGSAVSALAARQMTSHEMGMIMIIVAPICLLILMLATTTWIEPLIYLFIIGLSVVINMGTNIFLGEISFITQATIAVLQLAISMDYSLFLFHRYLEERDRGLEVIPAVKSAVGGALIPIVASCLTTVAGFVALMFMRYRIGFDMGLILAKGILLSFLCVMLVMPGLIVLLHDKIEKTRHRSFLPKFNKASRQIIRLRYIIVPLALLIMIPAFMGQSRTSFLYGDSALASEAGSALNEAQEKITDRFGRFNPVALLVPNQGVGAEIALADKLAAKDYVKSVQTVVTLADPAIPREVLPQPLVDSFVTGDYVRMVLWLNVPDESKETFAAVADLEDTIASVYGAAAHLAGSSSSVTDIKNIVESDYRFINMLSILAVALIVLLSFRSLSLPLILVFVIEISIWINMSIPYFTGSTMSFIGYMIVSALQLGATIDYAILLANRYMDFRKTMSPRDASQMALNKSYASITTSALILFSAGICVGAISSTRGVSELGLLIGRGAALSGVLVLLLLPQLLILLDRIITKTTYRCQSPPSGGDAGGQEKKEV